MKKILKILCCLIFLLSNNNVFARRMYFIAECESSQSAARDYGISLNGNGWYEVGNPGGPGGGGGAGGSGDDDDIDDGIAGGGGSGICNAPSANSLACDFGCIDSTLSGSEISENNRNILSDLNAGSPIEGNDYCKMVCIPSNQFDYPGFIPTVEQGTKFTWTIGGSSGILDSSLTQKILKLNVTTECAVIFDIQSWKEAYESAKEAVDFYNDLVSTYGTEYDADVDSDCTYSCPNGYYQDGSYCIPLHPPIIPKPVTSSCSYTYSCASGYDLDDKMCYLQESVYNNAVSAAATIASLKDKALACSNYDETPGIKACGTAYLQYSDEKYGGESHKVLLNENRGGTSKVSGWSGRSQSLTIVSYSCGSFGGTCSSSSSSNNIYNYKKAKFSSKADWTLPEYFYRYVLNNGVSIFNYNESHEFNNAGGVDHYYGRYQNYIDIGFPNFPVNFNSAEGEHEISIDFTFCSAAGVYAGNSTTASCPYEVTTCEDGQCPPDDDDDGGPGDNPTGFDVIYRVIDLNNPFPGLDGDTRLPGRNWSIVNSYVDRYITHNRGVITEEVYTEKEPMYIIKLTPSKIQRIREYNKSHDLNDFNLVCKNGVECRSLFLKHEIFDSISVDEVDAVKGCGFSDNFNECLREDGR